MYAERIILETDSSGHLRNPPNLPPNRAVEAIFLILEDTQTAKVRHPHPDIAGKVRILGDVFDSTPDVDWDMPR